MEARVVRDREAGTSLDLGRRSLISINTVRTDTNIKEEVIEFRKIFIKELKGE